jgi:hypothetical protein
LATQGLRAKASFLEANNRLPSAKLPINDWEEFVLDVAASRLNRDQTTARFRELLKRLSRKKPR